MKPSNELVCEECKYSYKDVFQHPCTLCIENGWDKKQLHEWEHQEDSNEE